MNIPPKYEDVVAQLEAANELAYRCIDSADRNHLRAVNAEGRVTALREELDQCNSMSAMIENREWAEHAGTGPISSRVESAFTCMHNELAQIQQRLTVAEQLLRETSDYLDGSTRNAVWCDSILHKKIKAALKPVEGRSTITCEKYSYDQ